MVITTILLFIHARFSSFNMVTHKSLKNKLISAIGFHMFLGKPIKAIGSNCSMKIGQSWLFFPCKIPCAISTLFPKFEAYPSGIFKLWTHSHIWRFWSNLNVKLALGLRTLSLGPYCKCNSLRLQYSSKSSLALGLSFVLPVTSITVLNKLSKQFFSVCMTSTLCVSKLSN